jgi:hypothetical protein
MKIRIISILAVSALTVFAFQNCGPAPVSTSSHSSTEVVVASTQDISKVTYDPELETSLVSSTKPLLSVDVSSGQMTIRSSSGTLKSCALDSSRLAALDQILAAGKICKPAPLGKDMYTCLAIGLADVKLEGADTHFLRPEICHSGTFLCDGQDAAFRTALADLVTNPPAACN